MACAAPQAAVALSLAPPPLPTRSRLGGEAGADFDADYEGDDGADGAAAARYSLGASAPATDEAAAFYGVVRERSHDAREARLAMRSKTMSLVLGREFKTR